jgi:NitT/TauT family transport system substrate-binding protein
MARASAAGMTYVAALVLAPLIFSSPGRAAEKVQIAYIGGTADVGFYIADARGYLREEGIEAVFTVFDSSTRMVAPLATGDIDVGSGAVSAALYNAFERGITMRVVADKAGDKGSLSYQSFVVRKTLWDAGEMRDFKAWKGHKIASTGQGNNESAVLDEALRSAGLTSKDVDIVYLSMPQQVAAYASGAIDASIIAEPFFSAAVKSGSVVDMMPVTKVRDPSVTGIIIYSDNLIKNRPDVAKRLMKAYVRGLRDYTDVLKDDRIAGPGAADVIDIIARYSTVKDKTLLRNVIPHAVNPDGHIPDESLRKDWEFYKAEGIIKGNVTVDMILDQSWVDAAVKDLGPYKPKGK